MTTRAKQAWLLNAGLAVLFLAAALIVRQMNAPVMAAGGGWDTDGIMANTTDSDADRLVIVDTLKRNIMVYKTEGSGQFRLMTARAYRNDIEFEDTSKSDEIERRNGVTYLRACELLFGK